MPHSFYLLGIDGGGTGTRIVLADASGVERAHASAGPSGLALGVERAWQAIGEGCRAAFAEADLAFDWSRCMLGCGLAGANHPDWLAAFRTQAPHVAALAVQSDAYTTLLGAHGGNPGVIVALGTGSIAAVLDEKSEGEIGACRIAGGFGFPSGDEASGAWLGLRAIAHAQQALDGRTPFDAFARALLAHTGTHDREQLIVWLGNADQTAYARLAPVVLTHCTHPVATQWLTQAGTEIGRMIAALDASGTLPVALCGGLGTALREWVPTALHGRLRAPLNDSAHGALMLARRESSISL